MKMNTILTGRQTDRQLGWHNNSLNTIRLIAALSVLYGHVCAHLDITMPAFISGIIGYFMGVPIFFAMSGLLIWNSVGKSQNFADYAKKRFWRIYPELWCAVVLGSIMILILYKEPIQWSMFALFQMTQGTFLQFWTPSFLRGYGCGTPNGSLWTICVLIQFYVAVYFLYKWLRGRNIAVWVVVFTGSVIISAFSPVLRAFLPEIILKLYGQTLIPYLWLFVLGAMVADKRDKAIPFLKKSWALLLLLSAILRYVIRIDLDASYGVLGSTTLILGLIGFAYRFPKINIKTDISYGIYLYHMIVVNAMIMLGLTGNAVWLLTVIIVSCILAYFSQKTIGNLRYFRNKS